MLTFRRVVQAACGLWAGAWIGRIAFDWLLGLDGAALLAGQLACALIGGVVMWLDSRTLRPWRPAERRDAIVGWGLLIGLVVAFGSLLLPTPWGLIAAPTVLVVLVAVMVWQERLSRRSPGSGPAASRAGRGRRPGLS